MLCTPSGIDYERLTPEDIVKVNYHTMEFEGDIKPTSEKGLHAGIYKRRPEAGAVIHTHSKYCSIFAACHMPLQIENLESIERIGEIINIADYGFPGTNKITRNSLKALGKKAPGCIMSNHGMLCMGTDIQDCFEVCGLIEKEAKAYIDKRWDK